MKKPPLKDYHVHVIPDEDYIPHVRHEQCSCKPDWDLKNKKLYLRGQVEAKVFVHNRWKDKRQ